MHKQLTLPRDYLLQI